MNLDSLTDKEVVSHSIVSQEMQKYSKEDPHVATQSLKGPSRARSLFTQKGDLRRAVLMAQILTRPLDS